MSGGGLLTVAGLLERLGYVPEEFAQYAAASGPGAFRSTVRAADDPQPVRLGEDQWFGVNPVQVVTVGRPGGQHITRLAGLWADLDAKPSGCITMLNARDIVDDLSDLLNVRPVAVTYSGHGMQPIWAVEDYGITDDNERAEARALLRQWGRLVAAVATRRSASVDGVFDLPRILRMPGSVNYKDRAAPVATVCIGDTGGPISVESVREVLAEYGITPQPSDRDDPGAVVVPPALWTYGTEMCSYARHAVKGWRDDRPAARHPWLISQATRIAAFHRFGCLTEEGHGAAVRALADYFRDLLTGSPVRPEGMSEVADAIGWGALRASGFSQEALATEMGQHTHYDQELAVIATVQPAPPAPEPLPPVVEASTVRTTDDGNARALVDGYGANIRFDVDRQRWLTWTGSSWNVEPPGGGQVRELVKQIARALPGETSAEQAYRRRSLSAQSVASAVKMAETDPRATVRVAQLDANPWALNTPDGLVDLRTGICRPARPEDLATRMTNVSPDPGPPPTLWTAFLAQTFGGDDQLIDYVQRIAGLALIGQTLEQILPFFYGLGANGKTTLLEALLWVLRIGEDGYAMVAPAEILMARTHEAHPTELAALAGARLVACAELEDGHKLAEARVKLITGSDTISARFLYGQPFRFEPSHQIVLMGNYRPKVTQGGPALWRRLRCVPFTHTVPPELRDRNLKLKLREAGGFILQWAIEGAAKYVRDGLIEPLSVTAATAAYESEEDTIGRFVDDRANVGGPGRAVVQDFRKAYEKWCNEAGETAVSAKRLTQELARRFNIMSIQGSGGVRSYQGVVLLADESDDYSASRWDA